MSSTAMPPPVVFDIDVAESAALRDDYIVANGGRFSLWLITVSAGCSILSPTLRLYRYRGNDPIDWVLVALGSAVLAALICALALRKSFQALFLRPQLGTTVRFDDAGIEVSRVHAGSLARKRVDFARIRSVRLTPQAVLILGRFRPIVIIPKRALGDDGARVMSFFQQHLVGGRMLQRSSSMSTTIVNTLAR